VVIRYSLLAIHHLPVNHSPFATCCREFRRQLEYKAARRGGLVVVADHFFASSRTCSACGHQPEVLPLAVRRWACPACGASHDRDVNAARNLLAYGLRTASSAGGQACGEEGFGSSHKATVAARLLWNWPQWSRKSALFLV